MSHHHGMLGAGALVLAFGAAFVFGHAGGEPKAVPVRSEMLTVSRDLPAIPALAVPGTPPALAKPARRADSPKRHRRDQASPTRPAEPRADPNPDAPSVSRPAAAGGRGTSRRRSGGANSGGGDSAPYRAATPAATPAPVQATPAPVEPEPEESEEEPAPEEEPE
jgi:hypothetical protein